jgi:hypothetical protein
MSKAKTRFTRENGKTVSSEFIYVNEMFDHPISAGKLQNNDISSSKVAFNNDKATSLAFSLVENSLLEIFSTKPAKKAKA